MSLKNTKLVICQKCWGTGCAHGGDEKSTWSKPCEDCRGIGFVRVPMTNADRIRAMSDEKLAENLCDKRLTKEMWLKWLKQPAEG